MADPGSELRGIIGTSRLLLQGQGEVSVARVGAQGSVLRTPRGAELWQLNPRVPSLFLVRTTFPSGPREHWARCAFVSSGGPVASFRTHGGWVPSESGEEVGPRGGYPSFPGLNLVFRHFGSAGRKWVEERPVGHPDVGPRAFCVTLRVRRGWDLTVREPATQCACTHRICVTLGASESMVGATEGRLWVGAGAYSLSPVVPVSSASLWLECEITGCDTLVFEAGGYGRGWRCETARTRGRCDLCKMVVGAVVFKNLWVCVCCVLFFLFLRGGALSETLCHQYLLKLTRWCQCATKFQNHWPTGEEKESGIRKTFIWSRCCYLLAVCLYANDYITWSFYL